VALVNHDDVQAVILRLLMKFSNRINLFVSPSLLVRLLSDHLKPFNIHPDEINPKSSHYPLGPPSRLSPDLTSHLAPYYHSLQIFFVESYLVRRSTFNESVVCLTCNSACRVSFVLRFLPERVVPGPGLSENKPYSPGTMIETYQWLATNN
jgi:hypothetical protein